MSSAIPQPSYVLRGHVDSVNAVDFILCDHLVSGSGDGLLKVWDLKSKRAIETFRAHYAPIQGIRSLPNDQFASSGRDGTIKVWQLSSSQDRTPLITMQSNCQHFCNIDATVMNNAPLLVSANRHSSALLWDLRSPSAPSIEFIHPHSPAQSNPADSCIAGMLTSVLFHCSSSQQLLSCGYEDGSIVTHDLRTQRALSSIKAHAEPVFALESLASANCVLSAGGDSSILRTTQHALLTTAEAAIEAAASARIELAIPGVSALSARSDGRIFAAAHWDHSVRCFQSKDLKPLAVLRHHRESVQTVRFCQLPMAAGSSCSAEQVAMMATGSKDSTIAIWKLFASSVRQQRVAASDVVAAQESS